MMGGSGTLDSTFYGMLSPDERLRLRNLGTVRSYQQGYVMTVEGQPAENVLVVTGGFAAASCAAGGGAEVLLRLYVPGDVVGGEAVLGHQALSGTVLALTMCRVLAIPVALFADLLESAEVARPFGVAMTRRVQDSDEQVRTRLAPPLERLARILLYVAERTGAEGDGPVIIPVELTQDRLAMWMAAHRTTAARALDGLRRRGAIRTGYGKITIVSPAQLREIAGSQRDEAEDGLREAPSRTRATATVTGPAVGTWRENPEGGPARLTGGQDVPLAWLENLLDGPGARVVQEHGALAMPGKNGGHGYPSGPSLQEELSLREQEIVRLVAGGWSNKAIAAQLVISPATAARHIANIMFKLGFHSRAQIATWAVDTGLTASQTPPGRTLVRQPWHGH